MPTISQFHGITVRMYYDDHAPPHVHAHSGGQEIRFRIETGDPMGPHAPARVRRLMKRWILLHQAELMANWHRAGLHDPLEPIPPLP